MDEVERLKKKCNAQLDYIKKLEEQLSEKAAESVSKLAVVNAFELSISLFEDTMAELITSGAALNEHKGYTSMEYTAALRVLEQKSAGTGAIPAKIIQQWADLGLICRDSRGKSTFAYCSRSTGSLRTIRVNSAALQLIREVLE